MTKILAEVSRNVLFVCRNCSTVYMADLKRYGTWGDGDARRSKSGKTALCHCPVCNTENRTTLATAMAYTAYGELVKTPQQG